MAKKESLPRKPLPFLPLPEERQRTKLGKEEEWEFKNWYRSIAKALQLDPDPDDPRQKYDYRGLFRALLNDPKVEAVDESGHFPSEFKDFDHPNRFIRKKGQLWDTKTGKPAKVSRSPWV